jgi:hypothetical protein
MNTKLKFISRNFAKFRYNNFAKFREISQINVAKFRRENLLEVFLAVRFDLKRDPDLLHKVDLFSYAP